MYSQDYKIKTGATQFSAVQLGEWKSEKMCLQPAPESAECLWRSDDGWQTVTDHSDCYIGAVVRILRDQLPWRGFALPVCS